MEIVALFVLVLFCLVGLIGIFFTPFGTLIILIGALLHGFLTHFSVLTVQTLFVILVLYIIGELLEYVFVVLGAKTFGASNRAIIGAVAGGLAGALVGSLFFGVGILVGTFAGIFLGAFLVELVLKKSLIQSLKAGAGGVFGRVGAIAAKLVIAIAIYIIIGYSFLKYLPTLNG